MDPLSEFLLALYRSAQDRPFEQFREHALSLLTSFTPFDSARWGSGVLVPSGLVTHHAHLHNDSPEMISAYEEVKSQDSKVIEHFFGRSGIHTLRMHPATHYSGREYRGIRDYARRFRHENMLGVADLRATDGYVNYLSLYRADERLQFSAEQERHLEQSFPHLLQALRINTLLYARDQIPAMRHPDSRVGIADTLGTILYAEPDADAILAEEWPRMQKGHLPCSLVEVLASKRSFCGNRVRIIASVAHGMVFFRARPLCPADALSARELEVARAIARGATHKVAALELGISPTTVRHHLSHIHDKLGVQNRAQLVAALAHLD